MRHFLAILAALLICAPAQAQTLKSLMYNSTNGNVVFTNNTLRFTNAMTFIAPSIEVGEAYLYAEKVGSTEYDFALDWETKQFVEDGELIFSWEDVSITFHKAVGFGDAPTSRANLGATTIGSAVFTAANATAARQALGLQSYTNTLTNSVNDVEIGSTVSNVTIGWTIAPTDATYAVRTLVGAGQTNSITNNSSTLASTGLALTSNTSWTLTVGDGLGVTNTATTSVNFLNYMIWGRSTNTTLSNATIQTLHTTGGGASRAFATGRARSFTMDGGGQFIFIAYPAGFGSASFTVGALPNTAFTLTTNSYTNASGYVTNYLIYRTDTIQNGTGINFVVQ